MSDKIAARTTTYTARDARQHLDLLIDQVIDCRDKPVLIRERGKEPVALVAAAALADWLETAAYPGKYSENADTEAAGDAERDRLARMLDSLETEYLLCSPDNARRLLEASDRAAAGKGEPLSVEQLRNRFGTPDATR
jgi:PHD/YefM family antitoxin component YafN of YafNO toxin-antitoxin module